MEDIIETENEDLKSIHEEAIKLFDKIQLSQADERLQCLADRRFYSIAGAQWEGDGLSNFFENRTKLEVNKTHLSVIRIINEYRNNRITVDFTSKDGMDDNDISSLLDGLYRADEQESNAQEAYDTAFEEAVGGGFGAWRLRAVYEDEFDDEDERQRIVFEPIYDADSTVFFDASAKRQDKKDARHAFILNRMSYDDFESTYKKSPSSVSKSVDSSHFDWATKDFVYVAEYYKVEHELCEIITYKNTDGAEEKYEAEDIDDELLLTLEATGFKEASRKKIKERKIRKFIMDGEGILEDCGHIAGSLIPIVPMYGKRWYIDGTERCMGHVRLSKDMQILKNIQISKLAEISALSSVEKPIVTSEQVRGYETYWREDNAKNYPYLPINLIETASGEAITGVLGYTKPPQIPPALGALLATTEQDMKELLGNDQALEQVNMNLSGEAIGKLQDRLDMQTYIYMSNMVKAMRVCGEIWLSMAKDIYVEDKRRMKVVNRNDESSNIELNIPILDKETDKVVYKNDISKAKMLVNVDVGASTSSKKQATVRNLITALQATTDQATQSIISSLIMMNLEGEGVKDAAAYFRKQLVAQGVIGPTEEEAQALAQAQQNTQPSAQEAYLQAEAENAQAKAQKAQADTAKTIAEVDKVRVETAEMLAGIERGSRQQALQEAEAYLNAVRHNQLPPQ